VGNPKQTNALSETPSSVTWTEKKNIVAKDNLDQISMSRGGTLAEDWKL
jgi:hypothetical protein